jgi:hypothetical protein
MPSSDPRPFPRLIRDPQFPLVRELRHLNIVRNVLGTTLSDADDPIRRHAQFLGMTHVTRNIWRRILEHYRPEVARRARLLGLHVDDHADALLLETRIRNYGQVYFDDRDFIIEELHFRDLYLGGDDCDRLLRLLRYEFNAGRLRCGWPWRLVRDRVEGDTDSSSSSGGSDSSDSADAPIAVDDGAGGSSSAGPSPEYMPTPPSATGLALEPSREPAPDSIEVRGNDAPEAEIQC